MESYIIALIGVIGVIIGALISGVFQVIVMEKSINNAKTQFERQMEQNRKEFVSKLEQIRDEQKRVSIEKASKCFEAENERFYSALFREMQFYDRLLNELHYLNSISHPNGKQKRVAFGIYPHIANTICDIVGSVELHQDIAKLLGVLRCKIDVYNATLEAHVGFEGLEEALSGVYELIDPINEECFENYALAQSQLREHEVATGRQQLQQIDCLL